MFIEVTLPHGTAWLRADRIESVMPIAQSDDNRMDDDQPRAMIDMINDSQGESWFVIEDAATVMERIYAAT